MSNIDAFAVSCKGVRPRQEDTYLLRQEDGVLAGAIFDGHGGSWAAELAREHYEDVDIRTLPGDVLRAIQRQIEQTKGEHPASGGACAVAFRLEGKQLEHANLGDAELVLVPDVGPAQVLSVSHRLSNPSEHARIALSGAVIGVNSNQEPVYVINPETGRGLMPTRSLGDLDFSHLGLLGEPQESFCTVPAGWLVVACDGLWDVLPASELALALDGCKTAELTCHQLALLAFERGSSDNVTVLVARINQDAS